MLIHETQMIITINIYWILNMHYSVNILTPNFYLIYGSSEYQTKEGHQEFEGEGGGEVKVEGNHVYKHSPTLFSEKKRKKISEPRKK